MEERTIDPIAERVARNDAAFRSANERIERAAEGLDYAPFLCECADMGCTETVLLSIAEYEEIRANPRHFLNTPGHYPAAMGWATVVADRGRYEIVEKIGDAGAVVEQLSERQGDAMDEPMDERKRRIGLNEAAFRAVNEQIDSLSSRFGLGSDALEFVCECGNPGCADRILLTRDEYMRVREDSRRFAVVPGHEIEDTEEVVDENDGYLVVQKLEGGPAGLARKTDVG